MKRFILFMATALLAGFTACSKGDDNLENENRYTGKVNPNRVFTGKKPAACDDFTAITYNADGLVTKMAGTTNGTVNFSYGTNQNGEEEVLVKSENGLVSCTYLIGDNGFAKSCLEHRVITEDLEEDTNWILRYNDNGQIVYIERYGDDIYHIAYDITYDTYGDITKIYEKDLVHPSENRQWTVSYTSTTVPSPIENKGCLMPLVKAFGVNFKGSDNMWLGYYAGLLGKATRHLPMSYDGDHMWAVLQWPLDADGYPKALKREKDGHHNTWFTFEIKWLD